MNGFALFQALFHVQSFSFLHSEICFLPLCFLSSILLRKPWAKGTVLLWSEACRAGPIPSSFSEPTSFQSSTLNEHGTSPQASLVTVLWLWWGAPGPPVSQMCVSWDLPVFQKAWNTAKLKQKGILWGPEARRSTTAHNARGAGGEGLWSLRFK